MLTTLQLRLTSGPKKSALELLRRKIEAQNDSVLAARQESVAAAKVHPAALWNCHMEPDSRMCHGHTEPVHMLDVLYCSILGVCRQS